MAEERSKPQNVIPSDAPYAAGLAGGILDAFYGDYQAAAARSWQEKMYREQREYNSPKNQMQRLLDAGLNPDLIYNQLDSSGAAIPDTSIPSSHFASALSSAAGTSVQAGLMESQISLNNAKAEQARSEAQHTGQVTQELVESWPYRLKHFGLQNGFKQQEINNLIKLGSVYDEQTRVFSATTENLMSSSRVLNQQYFTERNRTRYVGELTKRTGAEFRLMNERAERAREFVDAEIDKMIANAFHDSEQGKLFRKQTKLMVDTWDSLCSQEYWKSNMFYHQSDYWQNTASFMREQTRYLPVSLVNQLLLYEYVNQHDEHGNPVKTIEGFPNFNPSYQMVNRVFQIAGESMNLMSDAANIYGTFRMGFNMKEFNNLKRLEINQNGQPQTFIESTYDKAGKAKGFKVTEKGRGQSQYGLHGNYKNGQSSFHF